MQAATFIKFGELDHMQALLKEGSMYLNTLEYFSVLEDGQVRGDKYEGASEIQRGTKGSITLADGSDIGAHLKNWEFGVFHSSQRTTNIFSIFTLTPSSYPITERVSSFGAYAFVVRDPDEFMNRIKSSLTAQQINGSGAKVDYVPDDYTGDLNMFTKLESFSWQSEWRLALEGGTGQARTITIGDLSDIAFVCKSSEVNDRFSITKRENKAQ